MLSDLKATRVPYRDALASLFSYWSYKCSLLFPARTSSPQVLSATALGTHSNHISENSIELLQLCWLKNEFSEKMFHVKRRLKMRRDRYQSDRKHKKRLLPTNLATQDQRRVALFKSALFGSPWARPRAHGIQKTSLCQSLASVSREVLGSLSAESAAKTFLLHGFQPINLFDLYEGGRALFAARVSSRFWAHSGQNQR